MTSLVENAPIVAARVPAWTVRGLDRALYLWTESTNNFMNNAHATVRIYTYIYVSNFAVCNESVKIYTVITLYIPSFLDQPTCGVRQRFALVPLLCRPYQRVLIRVVTVVASTVAFHLATSRNMIMMMGRSVDKLAC